MLFAPIASGALISTIGYYVPFMWLGAAFTTVGSGLLFTLRVDSSSGTLSAFQFITGLGLGICTQISFTAVQYTLPKEHMTMGSALVSFCNSLGPILGTNIGQAIFSNLFIRRLDRVPGVDAAAVIRQGPTKLAAAGTSSVVREAFNYALTRTFILAVVSGCLAFACSMAMEWGNVRRERKHERKT
jgi:MFS family permease